MLVMIIGKTGLNVKCLLDSKDIDGATPWARAGCKQVEFHILGYFLGT